MKQKLVQWAEALHFPLWIAKDAAWFFGMGWLSLGLALPVIIISVAVAWANRGLARWEWSLLTAWLLANTVWMSSELISSRAHEAAEAVWVVSLGLVPFYVLYLRKHFRNR